MQVLLLGPVTVVAGSAATRLRSERQATLLAVLGLHPDQTVALGALEMALWGDDPPATARNTLQVHASALRRLLGRDAVSGNAKGYRLSRPEVEVDVATFEQLLAQGLAAQEAGAHHEASRLFRSALALWRGNPFETLESPILHLARERLLRLHLSASLGRIDADLSLGRHLVVLDELHRLAHGHPFDEAIAARLMVALYRSGRQQEAMAAFHSISHRLSDELGVDPGEDLRDVYTSVLRHGGRVSVPAATRAAQSPWRTPLAARDQRPLLGRDGLLAEVGSRLRPGSLVTLVGPSGVGKTRLAIAVAQRRLTDFPAGAVLVRVPDMTDSQDLLHTIAEGLDIATPRTDPVTTAVALSAGEALVVLDDISAEHCDALPLAELAGGSDTTWLATSTRPLGLPGESVVRVPPLPARDDDGGIGSAAELLMHLAVEAGGVPPGDEADLVACAEQLDGLPLALELAAPLAVLGWGELRARLEAEQRPGDGLTVSFESSLSRLDAAELELVETLAVADAGVDLPMLAELVSMGDPAPPLAALVRDGLVRQHLGAHGHMLYDQLPSVRAQVMGRQQPGRRAELSRRLVDTVASSLGRPSWYSPSVLRSAAQARRSMALLPLMSSAMRVAELDGLTAAATFAGPLNELQAAARGIDLPRRTAWLLDRPDLGPGPRGDVLIISGMAAMWRARNDEARSRMHEALALARSSGDRPRLAMALAHLRLFQLVEGLEPLDDGVVDELERVVAEVGDPELTAAVQVLPTGTERDTDRLADALARSRDLEHAGLQLLCLANFADMALERGNLQRALTLAHEAGALAADMHNPYLAGAMAATAETAAAIAGSPASLERLANALALAQSADDLRTMTDLLQKLAAGAHHAGDTVTAARCVGAYRGLLARAAAEPGYTERTFEETWLSGYATTPPTAAASEVIAEVLDRFLGTPVAKRA